MMPLLTVNTGAAQKNALIEVFLILLPVFYMPRSIKLSKKSFNKRWGVTDGTKLENYFFCNSEFAGTSLTLMQKIIEGGLEKKLLL